MFYQLVTEYWLVFFFVGLGAGLAVGAVAEAAKRGLGLAGISDPSRLPQSKHTCEDLTYKF